MLPARLLFSFAAAADANVVWFSAVQSYKHVKKEYMNMQACARDAKLGCLTALNLCCHWAGDLLACCMRWNTLHVLRFALKKWACKRLQTEINATCVLSMMTAEEEELSLHLTL